MSPAAIVPSSASSSPVRRAAIGNWCTRTARCSSSRNPWVTGRLYLRPYVRQKMLTADTHDFIQRAAIDHATQLLDNTAERINGIMDDTELVTNFMARTVPNHLSPDSLLVFSRRWVEENGACRFLLGAPRSARTRRAPADSTDCGKRKQGISPPISPPIFLLHFGNVCRRFTPVRACGTAAVAAAPRAHRHQQTARRRLNPV